MAMDEKDIAIPVAISAPKEKVESVSEEIANSVSHGLGFVGTLMVTPLLIRDAVATGGAAVITSVAIFCATLLLLYLASMLYHALPKGPSKHFFRVTEHALIFALIAGTYTPFTLGVLHGPWGWTLFGIIWTLAATGMLLKFLGGPSDFPALSLGLYLGMGWVMLIAIRPLWLRMPHGGLLWIGVGGLAYTAGVPFYLSGRRYSHFLWHLFVIAGSACHCWAVLQYAN